MTPTPIRFQIGARTLVSVPRRLHRVELNLGEVLAGALPDLPPLAAAQDGYSVVSLPAPRLSAVSRRAAGLIVHLRQAYTRYFVDLTLGWDGWLAGLSGNARGSLKRKQRRMAEAGGGAIDIRAYRTPGELAAFHALARGVSAATYQEKLLDAGLPADDAFLREMEELAAQDRARGWLLFLRGEAIAYLYCPAEGGTLIYDRLGHDPAHGDLSPGVVLLAGALKDAMEEARFGRMDFTSGEGQHKRAFATGGAPCVDLLLLRPTLANRVVLGALDRFDRAMALGKRAAAIPALRPLTQRLRRA
ncbi:GNAT family N-acetyltransferase [Sphingomonas gilva]|uniref:GNAT family N-acetyltransferase n=1 Tax=Sphingomonas gilva TaxID=2305907 RepID=UPI001FE2F8C0|nr:GNAT family N-acetyltransferase [Sphingomonas gilva]